MKKAWFKFYPSDWRSDPMLRMCSLGARGLWMEMICLMHEATPCGSLLVNGKKVTPRQLASLAGSASKEVEGLLSELQEAGVFSTEDDGTIFSRRIRKDIAKAERDAINGKGGGNPNLLSGVNPTVNPKPNGKDNQGDNLEDKARATRVPEARVQKVEEELEIAAQPSTSAQEKRLEPHNDGPDDYAKAMTACVKAIGDGHPADPVFGPIMLLVERGIPLNEITTVMRSEASARRAKGQAPIKYWSKWAEIAVERLNAAPKIAPPQDDPNDPIIHFDGDLKWKTSSVIRAVRKWREDPRSWPAPLGLSPDHANCQVPRHLLDEVMH